MKIITKETMKNAEAAAVRSGLGYLRLMENAGTAAARVIRQTVSPEGKTAAILCGSGNNGGDGFVIARKLLENGAEPVVILASGEPHTKEAAEMLSRLSDSVTVYDGAKLSSAALRAVESADIIVDAIFGTGLSRQIEGFAAELIRAANKSEAVRFAVDIPSGVECDTGKLLGESFKADYTVTFEAMKPCHILPPANEFCGRVNAVAIGIDQSIINALPVVAETIDSAVIKPRHKNDHKGTFGTALSVTGSYGMSGAAVISGLAALRCGVGIMKTACINENYPVIAAAVPESVLVPCASSDGKYSKAALPILKNQLKTASALLIGCGLGVSCDTAFITRELALSSSVPVIIDADGINAVAPDIEFTEQMKAPLIMTPHPKEMARLCKTTVAEIQADRIGIARRFSTERGVYLVLKGANTVVATPDGEVYVNMSGNAGMAVGGSGDMLSGMTLSLLAQGYPVKEAVCTAVKLHGDAGDRARDRLGEISLLPRDMIEELPYLFK